MAQISESGLAQGLVAALLVQTCISGLASWDQSEGKFENSGYKHLVACADSYPGWKLLIGIFWEAVWQGSGLKGKSTVICNS